MELGEYIRNLRQRAGLSLRKLADVTRTNPSYLSRVERGQVPPSDDLVRAVATALGVEHDELFLLAGRVPPGWQGAIGASPCRVTRGLRAALAESVAEASPAYARTVVAFAGTRAIEDPAFPFEHLSEIAELESWRKELNRPIYHIHKWWAQRLGSVFRAIVLGTFAPRGSNVLQMFYQPSRLPGAIVFDPFMGSGTTVGETLKLGARAIGRDINPVAHFIVRNALTAHSRAKVVQTFREIERDVAPAIRRLYRARLPNGETADVLYCFWVKVVPCPACTAPVELFSSRVFMQHFSPARRDEARAVCPQCGAINVVRRDATRAMCPACRHGYDPQRGAARGASATCRGCGHTFAIAKAVQNVGAPPGHRMYAKMVLLPNGSKEYLPADDYDRDLYEEASRALRRRGGAYPIVHIEPGYNTDQVLNYCYTHWHQMFNDRQLLCLGLLADRIRAIPDADLRELFTCLFSGVLEFNNVFASFKGEGTGAVRHMFAHHILKPERTPLEANPWGTPRSSGSFSTLFESRLLSALDYCENPFELLVRRKNGKSISDKVYGLSCPLGHDAASSFGEFQKGKPLYLSCGDSARTDIAPESVDAVVTDPPFFDNVHYSQLADFFYVWQRHILGSKGCHAPESTRSRAEVQQSDAAAFTERLCGVWRECHRVLRHDGLLVFTYHHSRAEGWRSVLEATVKAGFAIVAAHPIKAEMSVAVPKNQAREPIDLDVILVCRKRESLPASAGSYGLLLEAARSEAAEQIARFNARGRSLSRNDVRVVLTAQLLRRLSRQPSLDDSLRHLLSIESLVEDAISDLHGGQRGFQGAEGVQAKQLALW